jgi:hypothetical protein
VGAQSIAKWIVFVRDPAVSRPDGIERSMPVGCGHDVDAELPAALVHSSNWRGRSRVAVLHRSLSKLADFQAAEAVVDEIPHVCLRTLAHPTSRQGPQEALMASTGQVAFSRIL